MRPRSDRRDRTERRRSPRGPPGVGNTCAVVGIRCGSVAGRTTVTTGATGLTVTAVIVVLAVVAIVVSAATNRGWLAPRVAQPHLELGVSHGAVAPQFVGSEHETGAV